MPRTEKRNPEDLLNQTEAAVIIGVSRPTIHAMVARGEIKGHIIARRVFVTRESAERAAKDRRDKTAAAAA